MEFFEQILALTEDRTVRMALALAAVLLLILIIAFVFRRLTRRGPSAKRGRVARLVILEAIPVDQRRRLILLRRDNTEHLVMIGGPTDLVVEEGIHRQARQPANKRPAPSRAEPPRTQDASQAIEQAPAPASTPVAPASTPVAPTTPPVAAVAPVATATPVAAAPIVAATPVVAEAASAAPEPTPAIPAAEDPQIAEMERKLQDALKAPSDDMPKPVQAAPTAIEPTRLEPAVPQSSESEPSESVSMPDLDSTLEAAIADAVSSDTPGTSDDSPDNGSNSQDDASEKSSTG